LENKLVCGRGDHVPFPVQLPLAAMQCIVADLTDYLYLLSQLKRSEKSGQNCPPLWFEMSATAV